MGMWGGLAGVPSGSGGLATRHLRRQTGYPLGRAQLAKLPHNGSRFLPSHGTNPATCGTPGSTHAPVVPMHLCRLIESAGYGRALPGRRSEEHTSELQSPCKLVCRLLLEKKKQNQTGVKKKRPLPYEYSRVVIDNDSDKADRAPVVVEQWIHRSKFTCRFCLFFFNDTATTEIYTLSLHDALPI